jgi:small membrane protein
MNAMQIVLIAFAVFALSRVILRFRRRELALVHLVTWFLFWGAVIVAALYPAVTTTVANVFRVGRGADLVMYVSVLVLFYSLFRMFGKIEELERQITRVVRAAALKELDDQAPARALAKVPPPPITIPPPPPIAPKP